MIRLSLENSSKVPSLKIEGCNVIGMAADGNEALTVIRDLRPDIVTLDISMPHRDGIAVLREIRKEDSEMVIIMFTADPSVVLEEIGPRRSQLLPQ